MKTGRILILSTLIFLPLIVNSQSQIASDIDGLFAGDYFGNDVSLSSDGSIVAVVGNGTGSRVFHIIDGEWTLLGTDINGENFGDVGGSSVSLSSDGRTLAIQSRVFNYDSGTGIWTQKGSDINAGGTSVSLSSDGNIIALGNYSYTPSFMTNPPPQNYGIVGIFRYELGDWIQIGDDFAGEDPGTKLGFSVSLSNDGNTVAISRSSSIWIYENISDVWTLKGSEINISTTAFKDVSLSADGNTIAIGEPNFSDTEIQRGRVQVFHFDVGNWVQIGSDIVGEVPYYLTGWQVSLSDNGQVLAVGEIGSTSGSTDKGRVRIFNNQGGDWVQLGNSIFGEASEDYSGYGLSLSSDATTVAIGARYNDGNGIDSGHTRVYNLSSTLSSNDSLLSKLNLFPNPTKNQFTIQLLEGLELQSVNIYNSLGQILYSTQKIIVKTSELPTGIYFVEIVTNKGRASKKIVIK